MTTPTPSNGATTHTPSDRCRNPRCRTRPTPGYAPRGLCPHCETAGIDAITTLATDWSGLQRLMWDKLKQGNDIPGGKFGPTEPINYAAAALAGEIAYTAVIWELAVRDRARLSEVTLDRWPTYPELARAVRILNSHYSVLIATPATDYEGYDGKPTTGDGVDGILDLTALHRRAHAMIGIAVRTSTVPGDCPDCGHATMRHRDGANSVYCATCRHTWPWDTYQDTIALVPVGEAA